MNKKTIAVIVSLNFILPALALAQDPVSPNNIILGNERSFLRDGSDASAPNGQAGESREVMDGIGRMKKGGEPFPSSTSTASATTTIKNVIDGRRPVYPVNPEILKAIKEGQRGEEFILFIKNEMDKLKDKKLMFADEINAKREDLKKNLDLKLKDAQKKEIAIRADKEINALNVKATGNYRNILLNIEKILNNIVARADLLEKNGRNVAPARSAIEKAKEAVALSRLAVETQSVKIYTAIISSENKIKEDVNVERAAVRADLSILKDSIETARNTVKDAAVALARVAGLGGGVSATSPKTTQ